MELGGISRDSRFVDTHLGLDTTSPSRVLARYGSGVQFLTRAMQIARSSSLGIKNTGQKSGIFYAVELGGIEPPCKKVNDMYLRV